MALIAQPFDSLERYVAFFDQQPLPVLKHTVRELQALPDRIAALEDEQTAAQARLNDPSIYRDAPQDVPVLNSRLQALEAEIEAAMLRWEDLESRSGKK